MLVPPDDPVKLVCLSVRNTGDRPRRLSATFYAEWVLGTVRENAPLQVVCERDAESGAVLARNAWAGDFAGSLAFAAVGPRPHSAHRRPRRVPGPPRLAVRAGRPRSYRPVGPRRAALDPCAALMTPIVLAPGQAEEVVFVLGQADTLGAESGISRRSYTAPGRVQEAFAGGPAPVGPDPGCRPGDEHPTLAWT